jgi:hypothetical protein
MGNRPSGEETTPQPSAADQPGQGVQTLLRGVTPATPPPATPFSDIAKPATPKPPSTPTEGTSKPFLPAWYLLGADLLLTSMGVVLFFKTITTSGCMERLLYVGLVLFGCLLGVIGAWMNGPKDGQP